MKHKRWAAEGRQRTSFAYFFPQYFRTTTISFGTAY